MLHSLFLSPSIYCIFTVTSIFRSEKRIPTWDLQNKKKILFNIYIGRLKSILLQNRTSFLVLNID